MKYVLMVLLLTNSFIHLPNAPVLNQFAHLAHTDTSQHEPVVIDSHNDTMMHVIDQETWLPILDIGEETALELDIPKGQEGGLDVAFFAAYTSGFDENNPRSISRTLALLNGLYWTEENNPDSFQIATDTESMHKIVSEGKLAAVPTIEGAYSLEEHNAIELLRQYYDLGVQAIGLQWNFSNALGEGADRIFGDDRRTPSEGGLTELGADVVREMNRLGIVVDVSHMARKTYQDVLEVTNSPIIASHSGVYSLREHQRNLTDEEMLALKDNGGVLSIVFFPYFLTESNVASVSDIVDHIDYAVDIMGINHVGLGSDYDGATLPEDLQSARDLPRIKEELISRGYSMEEIDSILGGNLARVLRENEERAEVGPTNYGPVIEAELDMGDRVNDRRPILKAQVGAEDLDLDSLTVIVDGIVYEPRFDEDTATISLELEDKLEEKFHVATFQGAVNSGEVTRETVIFYVED